MKYYSMDTVMTHPSNSSSQDAVRLHVVVLFFNRPDCLGRLFETLIRPAAAMGILFSIIDNGSDPETQALLQSHQGVPGVEVIFNGKNLGVAGGRNVGFRRVERPFVVCLDDDSLLSPSDLLQIPSHFDQHPMAGILSFEVVHGETGNPHTPFSCQPCRAGNFHGAGHAIRQELFQQIGFLDEACFFGGEELEYSMRTATLGLQTWHVPLKVQHFSFQRVSPVAAERCIRWSRNYAMVLARYLPVCTALLFSMRLGYSYLGHLFRLRSLRGLTQLPLYLLLGLVSGWRSRKPLPEEACAFYALPSTRPELGNIPLTQKFRDRMAKANPVTSS